MFMPSVFKSKMLRSMELSMFRALILFLAVLAFCGATASRAVAQDFTLTPLVQLHPVNFGGSSTAIVELQPTGGFNSAVSFTCTVTPVETTGTPVCTVSPASETPGPQGAQISVTVTTSETTPAVVYQIVVTGTSGGLVHTISLTLGVTPLSVDYTLAVSPTTATPSPVKAGSSATTTVTVTPIGSYSGHTVTLSCFTVTPVVLLAPVCTFNPAAVLVNSGTPPTSILTITTSGPAPTAKGRNPRTFYALWLSV